MDLARIRNIVFFSNEYEHEYEDINRDITDFLKNK